MIVDEDDVADGLWLISEHLLPPGASLMSLPQRNKPKNPWFGIKLVSIVQPLNKRFRLIVEPPCEMNWSFGYNLDNFVMDGL